MNLKVPRAILPLGCAILSSRAKTVRGVVATPLRRTRVKEKVALTLPLILAVTSEQLFKCKSNKKWNINVFFNEM